MGYPILVARRDSFHLKKVESKKLIYGYPNMSKPLNINSQKIYSLLWRPIVPIMKRTIFVIICLAGSACAAERTGDTGNKSDLAIAVLKYAINKHAPCQDCGFSYLFLGTKDVTIDQEFLDQFDYPGFTVLKDTESSSSCKIGVVLKGTNKAGYAFRVFDYKEVSTNVTEVQWGYWKNCQDYNYNFVTYKYSSRGWVFVSNREKDTNKANQEDTK